MIYFLIISSFLFNNDSISNSYFQYQLKNNFKIARTNNDSPQPLKYALYSAILPGSGEYILSKKSSSSSAKKRGLFFFGLEMISWGVNISYKNKYKNQMESYQKYADNNWSFADWIYDYHDFEFSEYSYLWENPAGEYLGIGESSHFVQFYYGESNQIIRTTDPNFIEELQWELIQSINSGDDIYSGEHSIEVIKDQHFYENIGKYNEFFSGWADGDTTHINISITNHGYHTARSPIKNNYLDSYDRAETFSDYAENAMLCIYFNHFISMIDAFILTHKFNGNIALSSSTVFNKKILYEPIGIKLSLAINI